MKSQFLLIILVIVVMADPVWAVRGQYDNEVRGQLQLNTKIIKHFDRLADAPGIHRKGVHGVELGNLADKEEVISAVESYLSEDPNGLRAGKVSMRNLGVDYYMEVPATENHPAMIYVQMGQYYKGRKVLDAGVKFSIKKIPNGSDNVRHVLMLVKSQLIPENQLRNVVVTHNTDPLRMKAEQALDLPYNSIAKSIDHVIVYDKQEKKLLALFEVVFEEKSNFSVFVREDNNEVYGVKDSRQHLALQQVPIHGDVTGRGVLFDPSTTGSNLDHLRLSDLKLTVNNTHTTYTDQSGAFIFHGVSSGLLEGELEGRWVDVSTSVGVGMDLQFSSFISGGQPVHIVFNDQGSDEYNVSQVNAYYHTTVVHDWTIARLPSLTALNMPIPTEVNIDFFSCNAWYSINSVSMHFLAAGNFPVFDLLGCINFAYDTIIYHEYGHFVDDMAGGIINPPSALSEGWGDIFSAFVSGQPLTGEGWIGPGTVLRTADNDFHYPADGFAHFVQEHELGQAWAGFAWHLRDELIVAFGQGQGIRLAENIVMSSMLANSGTIVDALIDLIILDDDDGDLSNGTPHFTYIQAAADRHGLDTLPHEAMWMGPPFNHAVMEVPPNNILTISGTTETAPTGYNFRSYQLFYGVGANPSVWFPITGLITTPVIDGVLATWDMSVLTDETHTVKLVIQTDIPIITFQYSAFVHKNPPWDVLDVDWDDREFPDISGNYAVWWSDAVIGGNDIVLYDFTSGSLQNISVVGDMFDPVKPSISGDYVVWKEGFPGEENIMIYDVNNPPGSQQPITNTMERQRRAVISGLNIAWEDWRNGEINRDIYFCQYDPGTGACPNQQITSNVDRQEWPEISGDDLVWQSNENNNWDVYHVNVVAGGTPQQVTLNTEDQIKPKVSNGYIVYMTEENGDWDIGVYRISTGANQVLVRPGDQVDPNISFPWLTWVDGDGEFSQIHARNLSTGQTLVVTDGYEKLDSRPAIDGNRLIWESTLGGFFSTNIWGTMIP